MCCSLKNFRYLSTFLPFYLSTFLPFTCLYGNGAGTTTGVTLLSAVGVRQLALGNSGSTVNGDVCSAFYNPALLPDISKKQLSTFFTTGLSDDYKASVVYGMPLLSSRQKAALSFGVCHLNGGKMEINYVDGRAENVTAQSDFLVFLGWGGYSSKSVSVGYNVKYLSSKLVGRYSSSAIVFDMGMQAKSDNERFEFGLVAQNYGAPINYKNEEEPLPFLIRSGFSYLFSPRMKSGATKIARYSLLVTIDGFYIIKEKVPYSSCGLEYSILEKYFLRCGAKIMPDRYNFTLGAGIRFHEKYSIDWATELSELNNPHSVAFMVRF